MKAIARMLAVSSAIGIPFMPAGTSSSSSRSRSPAKSTSASEKPMAVAVAKTTDSPRLYSFCTSRMAIPRTAQFVVISGRKMPSAW